MRCLLHTRVNSFEEISKTGFYFVIQLRNGQKHTSERADDGIKFFQDKFNSGDKIKFTINRKYANCTVSLNDENLGVIWKS